MLFKLFKIFFVIIFTLFSSVSFAEGKGRLSLGLGIAHNNTILATYPSGVVNYPSNTQRVKQESLVFEISGYVPVSTDWSVGVGTLISSGKFPLDGSMAVWLVDVFKLEYSPFEWFSLRVSGGVSKQFQEKVGHGKQYGMELVYNFSKKYSVGLAVRKGDVDQEQRDGYTDYIGGEYELNYLFFQTHF